LIDGIFHDSHDILWEIEMAEQTQHQRHIRRSDTTVKTGHVSTIRHLLCLVKSTKLRGSFAWSVEVLAIQAAGYNVR
jgi:hypothetical protein